jgi:alpha,alpha-trehalase
MTKPHAALSIGVERVTESARTPLSAVLFDLDGVITSTAAVHAAAWAQMFDEYLAERASKTGEPFRPFDIDADYRRYLDGKPRYEAVRDFLAARGIALPFGVPADASDRETVCGLGNRKNEYFHQRIEQGRVEALPGALALVDRLAARGVSMAIVSSSRNARAILEAVGLISRFPVIVDGFEVGTDGLPGKPDPAMFLEAARRLHVEPIATAVIEDAVAGIQAARRGGFGLAIGIGHEGHGADLLAAGADVVISDISQLDLDILGLCASK